MQSVEALKRFAEFQAATAATDIFRAEAVTVGEGSTDPLNLRSRSGRVSSTSWNRLIGFGSRSPTGGADIEIFEPTPDEMPASIFETLDALRSPRGQLQRQIEAIRFEDGLSYKESLAHRLDFLLDAFEEEGEIWKDTSPDSLRQMLIFLRSAPNLGCPTITITPSATFRAQWQAGQNRHLAVDFLADGQVRFVVFSPDPRKPDRVQRVSGIVARSDLIRAVEPYKVDSWAADAGA